MECLNCGSRNISNGLCQHCQTIVNKADYDKYLERLEENKKDELLKLESADEAAFVKKINKKLSLCIVFAILLSLAGVGVIYSYIIYRSLRDTKHSELLKRSKRVLKINLGSFVLFAFIVLVLVMAFSM